MATHDVGVAGQELGQPVERGDDSLGGLANAAELCRDSPAQPYANHGRASVRTRYCSSGSSKAGGGEALQEHNRLRISPQLGERFESVSARPAQPPP
jgi:hypothetical protein